MGTTDDEGTVYCDIQMPLAQGRELLQLVSTLRESKAYPTLDGVFERMQDSSAPQSISLRTHRTGGHGVSE